MKNRILTALAIVSMAACTAFGQAYKVDYATKLSLAGNGNDVAHTFTLTAPTLGSALSWVLPNVNGSANSVLQTDGAGNLSWAAPLSSTAWIIGGNTSPSSNIIGNNTADLDIRAAGNTVLYLNGTNKSVGVGLNNPTGQLSNTHTNVLIGGTFGIPADGLLWNSNNAGWATIINSSFSGAGGNGLGINVTNNTSGATAFMVQSTGAVTFDINGDHSIVAEGASNVIIHGGLQITTGAALNDVLTSDATGKASWTSLSTLGVTSITANSPITADHSTGAVTIGVQSTDLTSSSTTSGLSVTGGTGVLLGTSAADLAIVKDATLQIDATNHLGIDLTHDNGWTGKQTITGAGTFAYVDGNQTAGFVLTEDGSGVATWTDPSTLGVTSITANSPITADHSTGAVTIGVQSTDLTSSSTTSGLSVTGGTGVLLGTSAADLAIVKDATLQIDATNHLGIDLTHDNGWTGKQTITGAGTFAYVDGNQTAGFVLTEDGSGVATWASLPSISASAWSLVGNTGLTAGTNNMFGTTDATDVVMESHGATQMTLLGTNGINLPQSTATGIGVIFMNNHPYIHSVGGSSNAFFGSDAGNVSQTGGGNVGVGNDALQVLTSGGDNNAIGRSAAISLQTGNSNIAIGTDALHDNVSSNFNIAIGQSALQATTGNRNTAIGRNAGETNVAGSQNTFVGHKANVNAAGLNNAMALGDSAIATASNSVQIGNAAVTLVNTSGNYTTTSGVTLSGAASTVSVSNGVGAAGQVLQSNASSTPTWVNSGSTISLASTTTSISSQDAGSSTFITATQSLYLLSPSLDVTLHGLTGGTDGRVIVLVNTSATHSVTVNSDDASASAPADEFRIGGGGSDILAADGTMTLVYDGTNSLWRVISAN